MKFICIIIFAAALIFMGCSTTYVASKFESKEKFNKQFNNDAQNELLTIHLKKDSNLTKFISADEGQIKNDSLIINNQFQKKDNKKIPLSDIKQILYKNPEYTSAHLILKNGSEYDIENLSSQKDYLNFQTIQNEIAHSEIPLNEINKINFNEYSDGTVKGIIAGVVIGLLVASSHIINSYQDQIVMPGEKPQIYNFEGVAIFTVPLGGIIGGIIGRLIGFNYTYEFNP